MAKLIGVDLGFHQVKAIWDGGKIMFPSLIGKPFGSELSIINKEHQLLDNLTIQYDDRVYYIGNKAMRETNNARYNLRAEKVTDFSDLLKFLTVLGCACSHVNEDVYICTGLPVDEYNELKEPMAKNLKGEFTFILNEQLCSVNVKDVRIIPQGAGAFYDWLFDAEGTIKPDRMEDAGGRVIVVDVGGRTTNVITMDRGYYVSRDSFTIYTGMTQVHNNVKRLLQERFGVSIKPVELDRIMREETIIVDGQEYEIFSIINQAASAVADEITAELRVHLGDARTLSHVILTGGSLHLNNLSTALQYEFTGFNSVAAEPEYSNARGYLKYIKFLS